MRGERTLCFGGKPLLLMTIIFIPIIEITTQPYIVNNLLEHTMNI